MSRRHPRFAALFVSLGLAMGGGKATEAQPTFPAPTRYLPTDEERREIQTRTATLAAAIGALPTETPRDLLADTSIHHKAAEWVLKHGEFFDGNDIAATLRVLERGLERTRCMARGEHPWTSARGMTTRGYRSKIDGSVQPYAVYVPEKLTLSRNDRVRLDVILHGWDSRLNEVRFLDAYDSKAPPGAAPSYLTLHVFGRGNNGYRWAGETDVFEAIEAVLRNNPVDVRRVVLRGFSMGGAGAWHLGLHHPSAWASVEAGAGFTETKTYARLGKLPSTQEKALRLYDAVDYALNATGVPIAAYGGENDPQLQASTNMIVALNALGFATRTDGLLTRGEGIDFLRVVGEGTGHRVEPISAGVLKAFPDQHAAKGANLAPGRIRFVTYTTKYGKSAWLSVERLHEHYRRAEVEVERQGDRIVVHKVENIALFAVDRQAGKTLTIGAEEFPLRAAAGGLLPRVYFSANGKEGGWRLLDHDESRAVEQNVGRAKSRGVQGPIDDAFTGSFLCVRGTGNPWSPAVGRWSATRLDQFRAEWSVWMRGEARVKDDHAVTAEDIENHHLILFGDPGSNRWIARFLDDLPTLTWTRALVTLAGESYNAGDHVPVLIAPNPLNPLRYVVLNSGHTFGVEEFKGTNALLFPRLGDHAVLQTDGRNDRVKISGYFDERWSLGRVKTNEVRPEQ
ncbi:MAG: prolyl oligopeptidase family serine peptidase [Isosphaeraceae bacterium]